MGTIWYTTTKSKPRLSALAKVIHSTTFFSVGLFRWAVLVYDRDGSCQRTMVCLLVHWKLLEEMFGIFPIGRESTWASMGVGMNAQGLHRKRAKVNPRNLLINILAPAVKLVFNELRIWGAFQKKQACSSWLKILWVLWLVATPVVLLECLPFRV